MSESIYKKRMQGYYPQVVSSIDEFKSIIDSEYLEFEETELGKDKITNNAYLSTMDETRIEQWEQMLAIKPVSGSTLEDRRETIIARIRGQSKLNTNLINLVVKTFTGGSAVSWIRESVLYIEVSPPPENKDYKFENVEQEILRRIPAHLGFNITRKGRKHSEISSFTHSYLSQYKHEKIRWGNI